jgi:hypothetical protein
MENNFSRDDISVLIKILNKNKNNPLLPQSSNVK